MVVRKLANKLPKDFWAYIGLIIFACLIAGEMVYFVASKTLAEHFRTEKLHQAQVIAAAMDPMVHENIHKQRGLDHPSYETYQDILQKAQENDDSIKYAYSLTYSAQDDSLEYTLDGQEMKRDTLWLDVYNMTMAIYPMSGQLVIEYNNQTYDNYLESTDGNITISINQEEPKYLKINDEVIFDVVSLEPLQINVQGQRVAQNADKYTATADIKRGNIGMPVNISFTPAGATASGPGVPYVDADATIQKIKDIYIAGEDSIDPQLSRTAYGDIMSAYAMIRDIEGNVKGMVVLDITDTGITQFKDKLQLILLIIFGFLPLILIICGYRLFVVNAEEDKAKRAIRKAKKK